MEENPYLARTRIDVVDGLHRRATLPLGFRADFGVHGPIRERFRLNPDRERPLPVDYIVAATGG